MPTSSAALPPLDAAFWRIVDDGIDALGLTFSAGARAAIDAHTRLLLAWNAQINLTALRSSEQVARGHILDSLSAAALVGDLLDRGGGSPTAGQAGEHRSLLDLGSGGGFPGIPLSIAVGAGRCALVDSVQKKAAFLRVASVAATAALIAAGEPVPRFDVLAERAEDLADEPDQRAGWDVVVARAVGPVAEVAELGLPLLTIGGHVVAWKRQDDGGELRGELDAARPIIQAVGGSRPRIVRADPDGRLGLSANVFVVIRKARPTADRYPRQPTERRRAALLR